MDRSSSPIPAKLFENTMRDGGEDFEIWNFPKLKRHDHWKARRDHWKTWWGHVNFALKDDPLHGYALGTIGRSHKDYDGEHAEWHAEWHADWNANDERCSALIGSLCSLEIQPLLESNKDKSAFELLAMLKMNCSGWSMAAKWTAMDRYETALYYNNTKDQTDWANTWRSASDEIKYMNLTEDDWKLWSFINNTGPDWSMYRTVLWDKARRMDGTDSPSIDDILEDKQEYDRQENERRLRCKELELQLEREKHERERQGDPVLPSGADLAAASAPIWPGI